MPPLCITVQKQTLRRIPSFGWFGLDGENQPWRITVTRPFYLVPYMSTDPDTVSLSHESLERADRTGSVIPIADPRRSTYPHQVPSCARVSVINLPGFWLARKSLSA